MKSVYHSKCKTQGKYLFVFTSSRSYQGLISTMSGKYFIFSSRCCACHAVLFANDNENHHQQENIIYLKIRRSLSRIPYLREFDQVLRVSGWLRKSRYDLVVLSGAPSRTKMIFWYPLLNPRQRFAVMMATPSVHKEAWLRWYLDKLLKFNLLFFRHILVPDTWPFDRFKFPEAKARFYEIGFQDYGFAPKDFSTLKLVYLGYIRGRDIHKTIEGLAIFIRKNPDAKITFDIAGKDDPEIADKITRTISNFKLDKLVSYHGFLSNDALAELVKKSNIGVCFVPQNGVFGYTSTKTMEYLIAGLPVLGTRSKFREEVINESNGILHDDNPQAFADALAAMYHNRFSYKPDEIRAAHMHLRMDEKIRCSFVPLLESIAR